MGRNAKGQFQKGCSGNPSGRKKLSEVERQTMESISDLAPKAVQELANILNNKKVSKLVKLKACELIIERVCGKATSLKQITDDPVRIIIDV